jgi:hypothetical protein
MQQPMHVIDNTGNLSKKEVVEQSIIIIKISSSVLSESSQSVESVSRDSQSSQSTAPVVTCWLAVRGVSLRRAAHKVRGNANTCKKNGKSDAICPVTKGNS